MPQRGFIFDMDGTLADSIGHYYEVACLVTEVAGAPLPTRRRVSELMSRGEPDLLRKLLPDDFPEAQEALERVRNHFREQGSLARDFEPLPGCLELLHHLHGHGIRLGIATSAHRALPSLDAWGVRHLFGAIQGREDVENPKPHPEGVERCMELLGLEPHETTFVGDSVVDVEAGRRAGVRTIAVLTGTTRRTILEEAGADLVLESAARILSIL